MFSFSGPLLTGDDSPARHTSFCNDYVAATVAQIPIPVAQVFVPSTPVQSYQSRVVTTANSNYNQILTVKRHEHESRGRHACTQATCSCPWTPILFTKSCMLLRSRCMLLFVIAPAQLAVCARIVFSFNPCSLLETTNMLCATAIASHLATIGASCHHTMMAIYFLCFCLSSWNHALYVYRVRTNNPLQHLTHAACRSCHHIVLLEQGQPFLFCYCSHAKVPAYYLSVVLLLHKALCIVPAVQFVQVLILFCPIAFHVVLPLSELQHSSCNTPLVTCIRHVAVTMHTVAA